jgi:hypothetical protein
MFAMLKETKPQLIFILSLLLIAVLFSLYQAVSSLSGESESPEYQRVPPAAFAEVPYLTLFPEEGAGSNLDGGRVADAAYVEILAKSKALTDKIFKGSLTKGDLVQAGMSNQEARRAFALVENLLSIIADETLQDIKYNPLQLKIKPVFDDADVASAASVESIVDFNLSSRPGSITYLFRENDDNIWQLSSFVIN